MLEDRAATSHRWLIEELDRSRDREHGRYCRRFDDRQLIEEIYNIGRCEVRNTLADPYKTLLEPKVYAFKEIFGCRQEARYHLSLI